MREQAIGRVRYMAVSATIPNVRDLAEWLDAPPAGIKCFGKLGGGADGTTCFAAPPAPAGQLLPCLACQRRLNVLARQCDPLPSSGRRRGDAACQAAHGGARLPAHQDRWVPTRGLGSKTPRPLEQPAGC